MLSRKLLLTASLLVMLSSTAARAQYGSMGYGMSGLGAEPATISGSGVVTVKQPPEALRMHIEIVAKGKDLTEALDKLKDRREAAVVQLETLGAEKDSITLGTPGLSQAEANQQRLFKQMVMQRMRSGQKVPAGLKAPKTVTVSMKLKAEWPLSAASPEERLIAAEELTELVKEADLAGVKQAEKLSPEEEELAEEMAMMNGSGDEEVPVGEPFFMYVARISDKQRDAAMAEAFVKAKTQAELLARAAKIQLGPLTGLTGEGGGDTGGFGGFDSIGYARQNYMRQLLAQNQTDFDTKRTETVSMQSGSLKFMFHVRASFKLLPSPK